MNEERKTGAPEAAVRMTSAQAKRAPLCGDCLMPIPLVRNSFRLGYEQHKSTECKRP